jgi:hypothetical protein
MGFDVGRFKILILLLNKMKLISTQLFACLLIAVTQAIDLQAQVDPIITTAETADKTAILENGSEGKCKKCKPCCANPYD